ncbi:sugar kinase [Vibrio sp. SCSIO 43132]|uniref:sugar kinase n=1 Tax=Vibrio sp. SCSIO 43132 TaxID=2779363 RepID=UPI001CA8B5F3|nr:sugar kinase [Vibrio sp. SCSIO 43132]UAB73154.1 sugar kinase [Vibrio sp. SCSIO 43132]
MKRISIIGECMIELNGEPFGSMWQTYGGDTLNAAVYLCRELENYPNSADVQYVTALGTDALSRGIESRWQDEGINTQSVLKDEKRVPGAYLIQLDQQGERTFLYWRSESAARYLLQHPDFPTLRASTSGSDVAFLSGISLAILPDEDKATLYEWLGELRQSGTEIAFDSNFRPALWEDIDSVKEAYLNVYKNTDITLVTFDDEQALWGDVSPQDTFSRLNELGVRIVVIRLGEEGCLVQDFSASNGFIPVPTEPVKHVVDTTSAGDSFNGAFFAAYLNNQTLDECCKRGNQLAGKVIQHKGAIVPRTTDLTNI